MDDNVIKHNALDEMAASVDHEGGVLATTDAKHAPYIDPEYTIKEQQKIIHRVDRRLIGTIGVMYCISQMDRTNLGFAAIAGMTAEMEMTVGFRYSTIIVVFFITYVLFQPPATVLCRKIGPRVFLTTITVSWGIVMICFGFPQAWTSFIPLRIILGLLEAGFFPACTYLVSTWYTRFDVQKRYAGFYMLGIVSSAFSGILAFGFSQMDGLAGYRGWRWIFIMEGIISVLVGFGGYLFLVDFPDRAAQTTKRFLSEEECNFILRRINADRDDAEVSEFNWKIWASSGLDWKIWLFAMTFLCPTAIAYAIAYFLPIILRDGMGYSVGAAQCLVAPPYAFTAIVMFITSWFSDKYRLRGPVLVFNSMLSIIGLAIMGYHKNDGVRYFGVFLVAAGVNSNIPASMAYQANNIRGQWKRAFCSATLVGFGGIGGVVGSLVFRSQDAPTYGPGIIASMVCNGIVIIVVMILSGYFFVCNKKAAKGELVIEGKPGFRYTY